MIAQLALKQGLFLALAEYQLKRLRVGREHKHMQ